jgi:hypothetical protein
MSYWLSLLSMTGHQYSPVSVWWEFFSCVEFNAFTYINDDHQNMKSHTSTRSGHLYFECYSIHPYILIKIIFLEHKQILGRLMFIINLYFQLLRVL